MANDLNRVTIIGRLTKDPEFKTIGNGQTLCKVSIANNRSFTSNGEKREKVSFFNGTVWGKRAEILAQYSRKGTQLAIEGSLEQMTWEGPDGKKQSVVEITIENFQFLGGGSKPEGAEKSGNEYPDDEIPF